MIVWGVYSVPAFAPLHTKGETPYSGWYWHSLVEGKKAAAPTGDGFLTWQFHQRVYGPGFPYFDFAPMFRAELFDPGEWMDICTRSGARYVIQATKHHDGFTLWQSKEANRSWGRPWNSVDLGPKLDLVAAIRQEGLKRGLHMGIYYSLFEWYNPLWLSDRSRYVAEHLFPQFKDIVTRTEPSVIFTDGEWDLTSAEWRSPELLAWLFNHSPVGGSVVVNDRWGKETRHAHGGYYTTEYTAGMSGATHPWEESRGIGYSYPYNRMEMLTDYHTSRQLILMLIDLVSRGGNFLLAIGPSADGRIPVLMQERLADIGTWLALNGEAIYGTHRLARTRQRDELREAIAKSLDRRVQQNMLATALALTERRAAKAVPGLHVLLAEDNTVNQRLASRLLEKRGHHVTIASNGQEVLDLLERASFDLILMDVQMPLLDGLEATMLIREREKGKESRLAIVALTAHAIKGDEERCIEAGMDGYLAKPIRPEELDAVLVNYGGRRGIEQKRNDPSI